MSAVKIPYIFFYHISKKRCAIARALMSACLSLIQESSTRGGIDTRGEGKRVGKNMKRGQSLGREG